MARAGIRGMSVTQITRTTIFSEELRREQDRRIQQATQHPV